MTPNQQPDDNLDWEPPERRRPRRLDNEETAEVGFPIAWVLIGGLAGLLTIGLIGLGPDCPPWPCRPPRRPCRR
jgi:hypothetical protein